MSYKSVTSFMNPKIFLQSLLDSRRKENPSYSSSRLSEELGFNSRNYLGLVLKGSRSLTNEHVHRIAKRLKMSFVETEWFDVINHLAEATGSEERTYYNNKLKSLRSERPKTSSQLSLANFMTEWYFPAVLVAADRCLKENLLNRISNFLPIPVDEVQRILNICFAQGLLREEENLIVLDNSHQVFFDIKAMSIKHKKFLKDQILLSSKMLEQSYEKGGKFYSHTFTAQKDDMEYYYGKLRDLLSELTARSDKTDPDNVLQLNIQIFSIDSRMKV